MGGINDAERHPDAAKVHYNLGFLLINLERFDESLAQFEAALDLGAPPRDALASGWLLTASPDRRVERDPLDAGLVGLARSERLAGLARSDRLGVVGSRDPPQDVMSRIVPGVRVRSDRNY